MPVRVRVSSSKPLETITVIATLTRKRREELLSLHDPNAALTSRPDVSSSSGPGEGGAESAGAGEAGVA